MPPTFSIIIPVYNVAPYLRECLDSVLAQTFTDWECICVDDGSTDGSGAILDEYADKDARFKVLHQQNAGPSVARNLGIENAKGEWLSFVDADDFIPSDYLSAFAIVPEKADINWFSVKYLFEDKTTMIVGYDSNGLVSNKSEILHHISRLLHNDTKKDFLGYTVNKFFRTELIRQANTRFTPGLNLCEDEVFTLEVLQFAQTIRIDDRNGYFYRWHSQGLTQSGKKKLDKLVDSYAKIAGRTDSEDMQKFLMMRTTEVAAYAFGQVPNFVNAKKYVNALAKIKNDAINGYSHFVRCFLFSGNIAACVVWLLSKLGKMPCLVYGRRF